ncbi:hypothetical protein [Lactobacillus delbrueckii]|uniref:hypothetical protein n=1 Tax=Lactobacillus delbrueckii TaxID=1584 RepID=UPI00164FAA99|nr:hypothetical protein [Lactobacillus delbrueckii]
MALVRTSQWLFGLHGLGGQKCFLAALWTYFFEFKQDKVKQAWQKVVCFLQLIINEFSCLGLASSLTMQVYDSQQTWTIIFDLFMLFIVVIFAFALTEKFTNRGGNK